MGLNLTEPQRLLALPAFWLVRLMFLAFDALGAATFGGCADSCSFMMPPEADAALAEVGSGAPADAPVSAERRACAGLLAATAALNFFALAALALAAAIRWFTEERHYGEAMWVTRALIALELLLKAADAVLPVLTIATCFPESATFAQSGISQASCAAHRPVNSTSSACPLGDFFATYFVYAVFKTGVGGADVLLNTPTLLRKPREWYHIRER